MGFIVIPKNQFTVMCDRTKTDGSTTNLGGVSGDNNQTAQAMYLHDFTRTMSGYQSLITTPSRYPPAALYSGIRLFKGTMPTRSTIATTTTELCYSSSTSGAVYNGTGGDWVFQNTDRLVHLPIIFSKTTAVGLDGKFSIELDGASATGTGTATWFILSTYTQTYFYNWAAYLGTVYSMAGTVSTIGGGGDLELLSTNVTTGQFYKLNKVTIPLPQAFSW